MRTFGCGCAVLAAIVGLSLAAPAQGLRLEKTVDGGWRFGDEALSVSLSGQTGWPVEWVVDGKSVLSSGLFPDAPWGVVSCASDGKGPEKESGRVNVLSVEAVGDNAVEILMEAEEWRFCLYLTMESAKKRASGRFEIERTGEEPVRLIRLRVEAGGLALGENGEVAAAAHAKGIRVWNDIVPHGGNTNSVRYVEHPEWYAVQEDGTVPRYWACDFNWPEWADYMAGVADYWMRLGDLDGFRIDAAGGSRYPNWNPSISCCRG